MNKIQALLNKHKREIDQLQKNCKHRKSSDWMEQYWAPGHSSFKQVKVCLSCGKITDSKDMLTTGSIQSSITGITVNNANSV